MKRLSPNACREEAPDVWQMRDPLPRVWQEFVSTRLLVRGPLPSRQGQPPCFAAKWHTPGQEGVLHFAVTQGHLMNR
jgi:hypothetical protein